MNEVTIIYFLIFFIILNIKNYYYLKTKRNSIKILVSMFDFLYTIRYFILYGIIMPIFMSRYEDSIYKILFNIGSIILVILGIYKIYFLIKIVKSEKIEKEKIKKIYIIEIIDMIGFFIQNIVLIIANYME